MHKLLATLVMLLGVSEAFVPLKQQQHRSYSQILPPLGVIVMDPQVLANTLSPVEMSSLVAVASAAAGAISQQPRIQHLQQELATARKALNETTVAMEDKMGALEEKLFVMDREYEAQTARFKRQYDVKAKEELERKADRIRQDFQFKLDLKLNEEKSAMLSEQLDKVNGGLNREGELSAMRIQKDRMEEANVKLEQALEESEKELQRMRGEYSKRRKVFGIF